MEIILTDIGSSSLGYKLIHAMAVVSHPPRQLKKNFIFFLIRDDTKDLNIVKNYKLKEELKLKSNYFHL